MFEDQILDVDVSPSGLCFRGLVCTSRLAVQLDKQSLTIWSSTSLGNFAKLLMIAVAHRPTTLSKRFAQHLGGCPILLRFAVPNEVRATNFVNRQLREILPG